MQQQATAPLERHLRCRGGAQQQQPLLTNLKLINSTGMISILGAPECVLTSSLQPPACHR